MAAILTVTGGVRMVSSEPLARLPDNAAFHVASAVAPDADFEARWATWIVRGRVHEQRMRRTFLIWVSVLAMGAAIVYAFPRS
jgi:hypothetical protein